MMFFIIKLMYVNILILFTILYDLSVFCNGTYEHQMLCYLMGKWKKCHKWDINQNDIWFRSWSLFDNAGVWCLF